MDNMLDAAELTPDSALVGRPLRHLIGKAGTFNGEFREHMTPISPDPEDLAKLPPPHTPRSAHENHQNLRAKNHPGHRSANAPKKSEMAQL